jgi:3-mercaptopyruvate sulfurtransferase SseA
MGCRLTHPRVLVILSLCVLAGSTRLIAQQDESPDQLPRITLAQFKKLVDANAIVVLDVRDALTYADGHIPGSLSVPLDEIQKALPKLRALTKPIVTYCS